MTTRNETGGGVRPPGQAAGTAVVLCPAGQRPVQPAAGGSVTGRGERGMVSAEWAVGIIAAIGIAGVLLAVVTSGPVEKAILDFVLMVIRAFARGL